jgi:hypothetical protein
MEKRAEIRRDVLVEGKSERQAQRETGLSWKTLGKVLTHGSPPGYRRTKPYEKPKIGAFSQLKWQDLFGDSTREHEDRRSYDRYVLRMARPAVREVLAS